MSKEDISYGVVGIIAGLVLGFLTANLLASSAGTSNLTPGQPATASVNSSSANQELPPGHPPLDSPPTQAPPLPAGMASQPPGPATGVPTGGASLELPSLEPLPPSSKEERAEQKYKNIQMLRGLPAERIEKIMFSFQAALGVECTHCHIKDQFEKDDKAAKQTARKMIALTRNTNKELGGISRVTCYTCHRGQLRPVS